MVNKNIYIPERGDIIYISLFDIAFHEQPGRRPCIVISPFIYNKKSGVALICPITSKQKDYPFEVPLKTNKISGVILSDQIRSIDWQIRKISFISKSSYFVIDKVLEKILLLLKG